MCCFLVSWSGTLPPSLENRVCRVRASLWLARVRSAGGAAPRFCVYVAAGLVDGCCDTFLL